MVIIPLGLMAQGSGKVMVTAGGYDLYVNSDKAIRQISVTRIVTENGDVLMNKRVVVPGAGNFVVVPMAMDDIPIIGTMQVDDVPIIGINAMDDIPIIGVTAMDDIPIIKVYHVVEVTTESGEVFVEVVE